MSLTTDLVEFLLDTPEVQQLVSEGTIGSNSTSYPRGFIFEGKPYARIDNLSRSCTVVVYSTSTWSSPLRGNRLRFPLITIEIWAAPTKNTDGTVSEYDADDVIEEVYRAFEPYIHLVHRSPENGAHFEWKSSKIVDSEVLEGPVTRGIRDAEGHRLGVINVGVSK